MLQSDQSRTFNSTRWTLLTAAGLAAGLTAGVLAGIPLGRILNAMIVTGVVTCVVGAVLGAFQAAGLRGLIARPLWWVAATMMGVGIGLVLGVVAVEEAGKFITGVPPRVAHLGTAMRALSFVTVGLIAGSVLGVAQWVVLRAQRPDVRHWVLVCGAALAAAFCAASLLIDVAGIQFASAVGRISFVVLSGILFGGLTSWPLRSAAA